MIVATRVCFFLFCASGPLNEYGRDATVFWLASADEFHPGSNKVLAEIIGWVSALILFLTISRQVYTEWRDRSTRGLSKWLFTGQLAASAGFIAYSWLEDNWVFVVSNSVMLMTAALGQAIYFRNKQIEARQRHKRK